MRFFFLFAVFLLPFFIQGQSVYAPLSKDYYNLIERYEILSPGLSQQFHSGVRPIQRSDIAQFVEGLDVDSSRLSATDQFNLNYLLADNWEWTKDSLSRKPFFKYFYTRPSGLFTVNTDDFMLQVNPVIHFGVGKGTEAGSENLFINTRGLELRGMISEKLGFYTYLADNQAYFPQHVDSYIDSREAVPGEGYTKDFKGEGYDFLTARSYITFSPIKNIDIQFGHDKQFIGNGYRSLILSDYASNYTFLKINTKVWKINYTNLFAELNSDVYYLNKSMPKKYMAFHHLSTNIGKHLNIGLFESIIFSRGDSGQGGFELNYLNPIIFYRSVEQQLGSEDNALLGLDFKLNFLRSFSLYGQMVLDEFFLKHLRERQGWWGNKHSGQIGLKYINVAGVKNLDGMVEANVIKPYTYSHESKQTSYTHYNHSLAHPLGANLYEVLGIVRYQPSPRLQLTGKAFHIVYGADDAETNFGGDILKSYTTREQEYNNTIAQGYRTTVNYISLTATYQLGHNVFIDVSPVVRIQKSELASLNKSDKFVIAAFRWNIPQRLLEF